MKKNKEKNSLAIFDFRNWLLSAISVLFTLILVELVLQIINKVDPTILTIERQSTDFLKQNKYWKNWHYASSTVQHTMFCFDATYTTNSFGLRGDEIDLSKQKIALIGDSYVEGFGVSNNETIPFHLYSHLDNQIEILNFGVSGGFGNVHAASLYENFVVHFKPDITLVFFLSYNDLYDNTLALEEGSINENFELSYPVSDSLEVFKEVITSEIPSSTNRVRTNLLLPYQVERGFNNFVSMLQIGLNVKFEFSEIIGLPYYPNEPEIIENGYKVLENSLLRLKELDAPNLILVNLPAPFQVDENWKKTFELTHKVELDIFKPNKRLKEMAYKLNIPLFDPIDKAISFVDSTKMSYPYFYNVCDKHFNSQGYYLMSEWLANWLLENNYVEMNEESDFLIQN